MLFSWGRSEATTRGPDDLSRGSRRRTATQRSIVPALAEMRDSFHGKDIRWRLGRAAKSGPLCRIWHGSPVAFVSIHVRRKGGDGAANALL